MGKISEMFVNDEFVGLIRIREDRSDDRTEDYSQFLSMNHGYYEAGSGNAITSLRSSLYTAVPIN